jgi:hypothetical protein
MVTHRTTAGELSEQGEAAMNHFVRALAVVAVLGVMVVPAWADNQQGQQSQGSQRLSTGDYIAGQAMSVDQSVQQVRFGYGYGGRPYYGDRYYCGPRYYSSYYHDPWRHGYYRGPWVGYRPYYGGGVRVGPVGVWW